MLNCKGHLEYWIASFTFISQATCINVYLSAPNIYQHQTFCGIRWFSRSYCLLEMEQIIATQKLQVKCVVQILIQNCKNFINTIIWVDFELHSIRLAFSLSEIEAGTQSQALNETQLHVNNLGLNTTCNPASMRSFNSTESVSKNSEWHLCKLWS